MLLRIRTRADPTIRRSELAGASRPCPESQTTLGVMGDRKGVGDRVQVSWAGSAGAPVFKMIYIPYT